MRRYGFIDPTKALEYMATGRAIVSTPVRDVVNRYNDVVLITDIDDQFIAACEQSAGVHGSIASGRPRVGERNSWHSIVSRLERHVDAGWRRN